MAYRVLVIDDEPDLELLIVQRFSAEIESGELVFEFAINGLEGLKKIEKQNNFEVILTDLKMPVMDGLELLSILKEKEILSKAIVASAYDDIENIRSAMNSGAFDFIVKPISFDDLKVTIYKAISEYKGMMQGLDARIKLIEAVKEKESAILKERLRISRDLHDDIGATLSSISICAETTLNHLRNLETDAAINLVCRINADAHDMVASMSDMVWLVNPANDKMEKLFDRLRTYATAVLAAKNIQFTFDDEISLNEHNLSIDIRKNIYLLFKEAINNALKYSDCSLLKLEVQNENEKIIFKLSDNGKGFNPEKNKNGNGLKNMQQRATEINAELKIKSSAETGTLVELKVHQNSLR